MGRICELYRIDDSLIAELRKVPDLGYDLIINNYANVRGSMHREGDNVFSIDKAWDVARFLIQKFLESNGIKETILGEQVHDDLFSDELLFISSDKVQKINNALKTMQLEDLTPFMLYKEIEQCYNGDWVLDQMDYLSDHIYTIKEAYQKAALNGDGLVVRTG